jgi:hypothetical protein
MQSIRILLVTSTRQEVNIKSDLNDPRLLRIFGLTKWPTLYTAQDLREIAAAFNSAALMREAQEAASAVESATT